MSAACNHAHTASLGDDGSSMTGDVARFGLESDQSPPWTLRLDLLKGFPANEVALVELHRPTEPRLIGVDRLVHIVAPQSQRRLESRRIASAETRWKHARFLAALENGIPGVTDTVTADEQLEAVLPGVPRPGDEGVDARHVAVPETEVGDRVESLARQELLRAGSLERDEGELESPIFDLDVGAGMLAEPPQVLLPVGGVDDDEETLAAAIDDEVVDDPACLVADEVVLRLSMPKGREVIGHEALQKLEAGVAGDAKTSHVRDIEQAGDLAHREV